MDYASCLDRLAALGQELAGAKFDLNTIGRLLAALGDPHKKYSSVIIAGTNGKGSTAAMLASILEQAGLRAGLYTSPHLVRVNERIRVCRKDVSDAEFAEAFTEAFECAGSLMQTGGLPRRPSYFEFITAAAFLHFARARVDLAVLEVGMGGRLDATNVAEALAAVITNVSLDHQLSLGSTVEAIAREKAGVIKRGRPVITGSRHPGAIEVIRMRAAEMNADLIDLAECATEANVRDSEGQFAFDLTCNGEKFTDLAPALAGRVQIDNAIAAIAAAQALRNQGFLISSKAVSAGLRRVSWPGRLERVHERPLVLLDGAHNSAAAFELARFVKDELAGRRLNLVFACMRDKSIEEISAALFPLADKIYLTSPGTSRAAQPDEIIQRSGIGPKRILVENNSAVALDLAIRASGEKDVVLVAGSLFLVGAVKQALESGALNLLMITNYSDAQAL